VYVSESLGPSLSLMNVVKANILIDEAGHACLADFGLLAIISDSVSHASSSSFAHGGTFRWMSPELFCPEKFGLKDSRRTKRSDCYALGMVIYEVLSGRAPFYRCDVYAVVAKVGGGERPERPEGECFTNGVWRILERCWTPNPDDRPRVEDVHQFLEDMSKFWTPLSSQAVAWNFSNPDIEESTQEDGVSSTSEMTSSHSLQTFLPKGDAHDRIPVPTHPLTRLQSLFTGSRIIRTSGRWPSRHTPSPQELALLAMAAV
jgi:hypothetical protein